MKFSISKKDKIIRGSIHLSGSKSISNRVLIIEALCGKNFEKENLATANDTLLMHQLLHSDEKIIDAHDAGTTYRFLTAFLSVQNGEKILTGTDRMKQRPIGDLVNALRELGASIDYGEQDGFPPLKIAGKKLSGGKIKVKANVSSQFVSALLLIAPTLQNGLQIELSGPVVSEPYIAMTLKLMNYFGIDFSKSGNTISVPHQNYSAKNIFIESDWSAASYFYEMVSLSNEASLELNGLMQNSFQGDSKIAEMMTELGVETSFQPKKILLTKNNQQKTSPLHFNLNDQPDLAPALFCACAGNSRKAIFSGIGHLKYKESNREEALQTELSKCGITFTKKNDGLILEGSFRGTTIPFQTYKDHRMAMAFAPLAFVNGELIIDDPHVVKKSYPEYWNDLEKLGFQILEIS